MIRRRITEDDLARVMELDVQADALEILANRFASHPRVTQDDIAALITIAYAIRPVGSIMRRFLNGRTDTEVAVEPGRGFVQQEQPHAEH